MMFMNLRVVQKVNSHRILILATVTNGNALLLLARNASVLQRIDQRAMEAVLIQGISKWMKLKKMMETVGMMSAIEKFLLCESPYLSHNLKKIYMVNTLVISTLRVIPVVQGKVLAVDMGNVIMMLTKRKE
ncbi:unnamed protein product [Strongylus vulgaris]|uniref:Uncharacterized protein n=1 Tax=Strongylus vulgaris TaxID=40348 RepID=A0A3P7IFJ9_STRVU|nr:unnamed protein product [Strongylus vulgaris]